MTRIAAALIAVCLMAPPSIAQTDASAEARPGTYEIDPAHTSITFGIEHMGIAIVYGRFDEFSGSFTQGEQPGFDFQLQTDSVNTNQDERDRHLRSADYFNVDEYPTITLTSTELEPTDEGWQATAELTMMGQTRPIELTLVKGGETEDPWGNYRAGYTTQFTIQRSEWGFTQGVANGMLADDVTLRIGLEGILQEEDSSAGEDVE